MIISYHFPAFAFSPSARPAGPACFPQRQTTGMYNGSVGPIAECIPLLQHGRSSLTFSLRVVENSVVIKRSNRPYHDENVHIFYRGHFCFAFSPSSTSRRARVGFGLAIAQIHSLEILAGRVHRGDYGELFPGGCVWKV